MKLSNCQHPNQPMGFDDKDVLRFKKNNIVKFLLDFSQGKGVGLNELKLMIWSQEDWQQFYQLIGYSVDGYCELSLPSEKSKNEATEVQEHLLKVRKRGW